MWDMPHSTRTLFSKTLRSVIIEEVSSPASSLSSLDVRGQKPSELELHFSNRIRTSLPNRIHMDPIGAGCLSIILESPLVIVPIHESPVFRPYCAGALGMGLSKLPVADCDLVLGVAVLA